MKRVLILNLILISLFLGACFSNKGKPRLSVDTRKEMLKHEMLKWENFEAEGVADLSYMGLSLRRMFVMSKTRDEIRFDVIEGGILGMGASPLISIYLGEYFSLESDLLPQLRMAAQAALKIQPDISPLKDISALVDAFADSILANGKVNVNGTQVTFGPQMRLQSISDPINKLDISFAYTSKGMPDRMVIKAKSASAELLFDKVRYGNATVVPLPRQDGGNILEQFLEVNPFRELAPEEEETP